MFISRIKSKGLSHISYLVGSGSDAFVVDPRRDCAEYVEIAAREELRIRFIFETHRNEDLVTGSVELACMTGAEIMHGESLPFEFGRSLSDGEEFLVGDLRVRAIRTPGHTDEHYCFAVTDLKGGDEPVMVFTGDTLLVGDVGRTDLNGPEDRERMAGALFDSLFDKIIPLGMGVIIYPAHGAGSVCGGNISEREISTIGIELETNPVLNMTREEFIEMKRGERIERPPYFSKMEKMNLEGPPLLRGLPRPRTLPVDEFREAMKEEAQVLDVRMAHSFGGAHIDGSSSIWLDGLSQYAGYALDYDRPILLVTECASQVEEAVRSLVRVGFDDLIGHLRTGIDAWCRAGAPVAMTWLTSPAEVMRWSKEGREMTLVDVRNIDELKGGTIEGSKMIHIGSLASRSGEIPDDRPVIVFCSSGHRGGMGASILKQLGHPNVYNMLGGTNGWKAAGFPLVRSFKIG